MAKQVTTILSTTLGALTPTLAGAATITEWLQADEVRTMMLFGICAVLLTALILLLQKMRWFKNRLKARTNELAQEQDQRVRAEVLLKKAHGAVETKVKERTKELEESHEDLLASTNRMRQLVAFDELTQLPNITQFFAMVDDELSRALRETKSLSVMVCEIDFFENYLESYGKKRADAAILKVAQCSQKIFRRAGDSVARLSENQFGAVFSADARSAERFAERLQKAIWGIPIPHDSSEIADRVTVSIGITTLLPTQLHTTDEAIKLAKNGLRKAQKQGGNQFQENTTETSTTKSTSDV